MWTSVLLGGLAGGAAVVVLALVMPRPRCSACNTPFPRVRLPASGKAAMRGGHTCSNCGQVCDRRGQPTTS